MRAIVDSDTLAFAAAVMAEEVGETQAIWNAENMLATISARLNGPPMTLYLTGENNFRYKIFPEYKANRKNLVRPKYLTAVKQYLISEHNAIISDGNEADDLCGIDQCQSNAAGQDTVLYHIDKDLNMIPGKHYNPPLTRNGVVIKEEKEYIVSPADALRFFYTQLLVGDPTDGIKGAPGIGKVKAERILQGLTTEEELFSAVRDYFSCDEELILNARCLWIWRKENDEWNIPIND